MGTTAEELSRLWENLTLMEEEGADLTIGESDLAPLAAREVSCVVGKLLADRVVGKDVIKTPLIRAWHPNDWISFKALGANLFLIEFGNECDKVRILEGRPWKFDDHLFAIVDYDGVTSPFELEFDKASFWVRMFGLPLSCMGREVGMKIGASVGEVEDIDVTEEGVGWGEFLRVRIRLDLSKPLSRGRTINLRGKSLWIAFQYEKIPQYCYTCGVIKHGKQGCGGTAGWRINGGEKKVEFGLWLRVPSPTRRHGRGGGWATGSGNRYGDPAGTCYGDRGQRNRYGQRREAEPEKDPHDGDSSENSKTPVRASFGKSHERSPSISPNLRNANYGRLKLRDEELIEDGDSGGVNGDINSCPNGGKRVHTEAFEGIQNVNYGRLQLRDEENNEGDNLGANYDGVNSCPNGEKNINVADLGAKPRSHSLKENCIEGERNIYVGQWDSIKEKMIWATVDKRVDLDDIRGGGLAGSKTPLPPVGQNNVSPAFVFGTTNVQGSNHVASPKSKKLKTPMRQKYEHGSMDVRRGMGNNGLGK
ncbi:uncharacterized protein LOC132187906 [Corylus avellana]|uniref:uncharacterized protein LOC132187906 n=1 Tax=Corylus avellana TaxID=13451 RepID=UPI00286CD2C8|nr:uncharacterized protein LOC132187906 [Corylus avellana]